MCFAVCLPYFGEEHKIHALNMHLAITTLNADNFSRSLPTNCKCPADAALHFIHALLGHVKSTIYQQQTQ